MTPARIVARDIRVESDGATTRLSCQIVADGAGLPPRLWFRFPPDVSTFIDPSGSPFVPILMLVAMRLRRDLHVEAEVSPAILYAVERVMTIYADWSADFEPLWRVKVTADAATIPRTRGHRTGAFFSCGLDSTYSLLKNVKRYPAGDARAIDHLLVVHGFDVELDDQPLFDDLMDGARRVAAHFGKAVLPVATNIREGGFRCVDWQHYGHGPSLASIGLALGRGLHTVYIPATDDLAHDLEPWGSHPAVDPLWSTETVEIVHDGAEARRIDKLQSIAREPLFLSTLRVCMAGQRRTYNCGACFKCLRLMLKLDLAGVLGDATTFPNRLDLDAVGRVSIPAGRARRYWRDVQEWARELGRSDVVTAIDEALARNHRADYAWLAPFAGVLTRVGVSAERLRHLKRRVLRQRAQRNAGSVSAPGRGFQPSE